MTQKEVVKVAQLPASVRSAKQIRQLTEYLSETILKIPEEKMGPRVRTYLSDAQAAIKVNYFKKGTLICTNRNIKLASLTSVIHICLEGAIQILVRKSDREIELERSLIEAKNVPSYNTDLRIVRAGLRGRF